MPLATTDAQALPVSVRGVGRRFTFPDGTEHVVLRDIELSIRSGEIIVLLGPSGSGKSTLLRLIAGLDLPDSGVVDLGGIPVADVDQRCAVAFQEPRLLPWRSIDRNVQLGLPRGTERAAGKARVAELLRLVQLQGAAALRPRQVSGGMAQRASLARALARGPGILLLDEPFGALDALTRLTMQDLLLDIHAAEPATILLVTHDVDEALSLADRVVLLGTEGDEPGATIRAAIEVPGARPRDRADARLARLRGELLERLGVDSHHAPDYITAAIRNRRGSARTVAVSPPAEPTRPHTF
jgi:sulfonate transport system ATP-binding protein